MVISGVTVRGNQGQTITKNAVESEPERYQLVKITLWDGWIEITGITPDDRTVDLTNRAREICADAWHQVTNGSFVTDCGEFGLSEKTTEWLIARNCRRLEITRRFRRIGRKDLRFV